MIEAEGTPGGSGPVPRATWLGIAAAVLLYLAAAVFSMVTLPWRGTADAAGHLDYIYQVHHRTIPGPIGYPYYEIVPHLYPGDRSEGPQWVSAHPPLFYAIASLLMGQKLDAGEWQTATARGRLLNILVFGLGSVLALAWAGWKLGGRRRALLAIALPAVAGCMPTFVRFSAEVYNDVPATLCSIVAITLSCIILREGISTRRVILLTLACICGMAIRATFLFALLLAALVLFVVLAARWWRLLPRWLAVLKASFASAGFVIAAMLPTSWFYWRNYQLSGDWARSLPKFEFGGRREKTLVDVLSDERYWLLVPRELFGKPQAYWPHATDISQLVFFLSSLALLFAARKTSWMDRLRKGDRAAWGWLLIAAHPAGIMLAQMNHAVGWGWYHIRYFLPASLSIGLLLVGPLSVWPRLARFGIPVLIVLMAASLMRYTTTYLKMAYGGLGGGEISWARVVAAVDHNGIASGWVPGTIALMGFAIGILTVAIWMLTEPDGKRPSHVPN